MSAPSDAARLLDAAGQPVVHVLDPPPGTGPDAFRDAVVGAALSLTGDPSLEPVAGVVFAARWGDGGRVLT